MQVSTIFLTALASLAATSSAKASCSMEVIRKWNVYTVEASGVGDIPGTCGGLWDNLKNDNFDGACVVHNSESCEEEEVNGNLVWRFGVAAHCNDGHVESAWWEATSNEYGEINC